MTAQELARKIKNGTSPTVVDVRSGFEYRSGHIPGSIHAPMLKILFRLAKLPKEKDQPLVITCEHGPRAQMAKTTLAKAGYSNLDLLDGHMSAWHRSNLPLEK